VVPPDVDEATAGPPDEMVVENARRKASAAAERGVRGLVLGVDTAVVVDGRALGKPRDEREARAFLETLSGRAHEVWSGIALLGPAEEAGMRSTAALTEVRFRCLEPVEIDWYLATAEWRERAGGYAIQARGAALVEGVVGDYWNVVGLPVAALLRLAPGLVLPHAA
jgi:septum formation protein